MHWYVFVSRFVGLQIIMAPDVTRVTSCIQTEAILVSVLRGFFS